jgi:DNA-binding NtrC family response regulator
MDQLENKAKANRNSNGNAVPRSEKFVENPEHSQSERHFSLRSLRAEAEIYAITRTLEYTGWNRRRAAQLLSISYRGILYKIRQHNLRPNTVPEVQPLAEPAKAE